MSSRVGLATLLVLGWTHAAFGEEWCFRIYPLARVRQAGHAARGCVLAMSSCSFGVAHAYQGPAGVVMAGALGAGLGAAYLASGRNAWLAVIAHGTIDSVAFVSLHAGDF